ncbi:oligosaccharide flippase family protein [Sphingomonas sp. AOB5]|uniref:oligosaccharide flippase family protein n=1 Tax=Sphingomonas sp. AOB5 TaxID=3034017 RepID=UPI0023F82E6B|nr:oligosaccharide flippase family protein [Sphingomonas sp. AOB5]MDF7775456.1 oligosaccharide flippase family protein [Sphingomonas sp. AOB5]
MSRFAPAAILRRLSGGAEGGRHSAYWRAVTLLTSGSFASQLIGIVSMLLLARIYAPAEFGSYAVFFAIAGLLTLFATAKYDAAIHLARSETEAGEIALVACGISCLIGPLIAATAPFAHLFLADLTPRPALFIVLLAIASSTGGLVAALSAWATQLQRFSALTTGRVLQSSVTALLSIALGVTHWDATGLMLGFAAGQVALVIWLAHQLQVPTVLRRFTRRAARARAIRHRNFPKFLLASELLNYTSGNLFSFTTAPLFGPTTLGHYSLGFRLATMPINLIGFSMGSIFRAAISPQHMAPADIPALYRTTATRLAAIGAAVTIPLLVAGPQLFRFAFGAEWTMAGFYVQILAPFIFIRFVVGPLTAIALRAGRPGLDTMIQLLFLASSAIAVAFGAWMDSFTITLIAFAVLQSLVYLLYLVLGYRLALALAANSGKQ